jgi:hypothetical protein
MQEYVTGEAESWSLFDQLIKPIPSLVYPFLFSLLESDHFASLGIRDSTYDGHSILNGSKGALGPILPLWHGS